MTYRQGPKSEIRPDTHTGMLAGRQATIQADIHAYRHADKHTSIQPYIHTGQCIQGIQ